MVFLTRGRFYPGMQALVTGGTGFIGSHLVDELLNQGYDVRVLRRSTSPAISFNEKKVSFTIGDLTEKESLIRACHQVDVVFHVAALPRDWGPKKSFLKSISMERKIFSMRV